MTEERKEDQRPEDEGQQAEEPRAEVQEDSTQMEAVTPPVAKSVGEEAAALSKLEGEPETAEPVHEQRAEAEESAPAAEAEDAQLEDQGDSAEADTQAQEEPTQVEQPGSSTEPEDRPEEEQGVGEDVAEAGETLAEAPEVGAQAREEPTQVEQPTSSGEEPDDRQEDEGGVAEDVAEAGETLAEAPAEWAEEAVGAVEHEAAKADEAERPSQGERPPSIGTTVPRPERASAAAARAANIPEPRQPRPSRRTLAREERRRRSERRRARRRTIYMILGGSVAAMLILGLFLGDLGITPPVPPETPLPPVGENVAIQPGEIIAPGTAHDGYSTTPPTSGPRYEEPAPWGVHDEQQGDEHVVRNLHMGAIVFNYNLTDEAALADLRSYVEALSGYPACYVMHPYPGIPEGTVVLTAWGWIQEFTSVNRADMDAFVRSHRNERGLFVSPTCGYEPPATPTPPPQETPAPDPEEEEPAPAGEG